MIKNTHIWFYSDIPIDKIARAVGMTDLFEDGENVWDWVTGNRQKVSLDITRKSTGTSIQTETVIFKLSKEREFIPAEYSSIIEDLYKLGISTVFLGQRIYIRGNEYDYQYNKIFNITEK